eukprot:3940595-Rhodomonas_salina.2
MPVSVPSCYLARAGSGNLIGPAGSPISAASGRQTAAIDSSNTAMYSSNASINRSNAAINSSTAAMNRSTATCGSGVHDHGPEPRLRDPAGVNVRQQREKRLVRLALHRLVPNAHVVRTGFRAVLRSRRTGRAAVQRRAQAC